MQERIDADKGAPPVGPYSPAVRANGLIFTSGQIPLNPETGEIVGDSIQDQARQALMHSTFNHLESVREIKKDQIIRYMQERQEDLEVLGETVSTLRQEAFDKLVAVNQLKHKQMQDYFSRRNFFDSS